MRYKSSTSWLCERHSFCDPTCLFRSTLHSGNNKLQRLLHCSQRTEQKMEKKKEKKHSEWSLLCMFTTLCGRRCLKRNSAAKGKWTCPSVAQRPVELLHGSKGSLLSLRAAVLNFSFLKYQTRGSYTMTCFSRLLQPTSNTFAFEDNYILHVIHNINICLI